MVSSKASRELLIKYLNKFPLKTKKRVAFLKWEECHKLSIIEEKASESEKIKIKEKKEKLCKTINT
jgi:hypothetical protein